MRKLFAAPLTAAALLLAMATANAQTAPLITVPTCAYNASNATAMSVPACDTNNNMKVNVVTGSVTGSGYFNFFECDATTHTQCASVDPSGNQSFLSAGQSGTATVNASGNVNIPLNGYNALALTITGTWVGTVIFKADDGSGTFPWTITCNGAAGQTSQTTNDTQLVCPVGPHQTFQFNMAWTSGTSATYYWHLANASEISLLSASGTQITGNNPSGQLYSSTGSLNVAGFNVLYSGGSNSWNSELETTENSGTYNLVSGIPANSQNSTGAWSPISADSSYTTGTSPITTATTTMIVAGVASKNIYVTGYDVTVGASATVLFETNSVSGSCSGGTLSALTFAFPTGTWIHPGSVGTVFKPIPQGYTLCAVTTGTSGVGINVDYTQF